MRGVAFIALVVSWSLIAFSQEGVYGLMKKYLKEGEFEEVLYLTSSLTFEDDRWKVYKARALIGVGELSSARSVLEDYLREHPKDEEAMLALAILELEASDYESALRILDVLKESPERNFLMGMAYLNLGMKESADVYMNLSSRDEIFGAQVKNLRIVTPKVRALLNLSLGYDTNPTIAPERGGISRQESLAYRAAGILGYDDGTNKIQINAYHVRYQKVEEFNTSSVSLNAKRSFGRLFVPIYGNYIDLGGSYYRGVFHVGLGYNMGKLILSGSVGYQDYTDKDTPEEDNRDGLKAYVEGKYHFPKKDMTINLTLRMGYENTKGKNWRNVFVYPVTNVAYRGGRFTAGVSAGAGYYNFLHKDSRLNKVRRDTFLTAGPYLRYFLTRHIYADFSYTFSNNISNLDPYRYRRDEVYAGVGGVF